jgi:hypothetical protein
LAERRCGGVFSYLFVVVFLLFSHWFIEGKMAGKTDTRVKGVMDDPPLFEDLISNNRTRRIFYIDFLWARHDHPLPPT